MTWVWVCTEEPYHDNSTVERVFDNELQARRWMASKAPGVTWKVRQDVSNEYRRGADKWVAERFDQQVKNDQARAHVFDTEADAKNWVIDFSIWSNSDDFEVHKVQVNSYADGSVKRLHGSEGEE